MLPRYDCLETLEPGEIDRSRRQQHRHRRQHDRALQLAAALRERAGSPSTSDPARRVQRRAVRAQMGIMPKVKMGILADSASKTISARVLDDGARALPRAPRPRCPRCASCPIPRVERYAGVRSLGWTLPIDDTHFRIYVAGKVRSKGELGRQALAHERQALGGPHAEEHQQFPGDWEAQVGPGPDHLAFRRASRDQRPGRRDAAAACCNASSMRSRSGGDPARRELRSAAPPGGVRSRQLHPATEATRAA